MERPQRGGSQRLHAGLVTTRIEGQRVRPKEFFPQEFSRERDDIVGVLREPRELRVPFGGKRSGDEFRLQHRIGDDRERPRPIGRQYFGGDPNAIVARQRTKRAADLFDELSDLRGRALAGILREHRAEQRRGPPLAWLLEKHAAVRSEPEMEIGEVAIRLKQKPRSVRQHNFLEIRHGRPRQFRRFDRGNGRLGVERNRRLASGRNVGL